MRDYLRLLLSFIKIFPKKYFYKFIYVLTILIISSSLETLTVYLIGSLTNLILPNQTSLSSKLSFISFIQFINLDKPINYVLFVIGICFISLILSLYSTRCISFFTAELTSFTNKNIILNIFNTPYSDFNIRKTSSILNTLTTLANQLQDYILRPFFIASKGLLLTTAIFILFLLTSVKLTFILTVPPLISYFLILMFIKSPISKSGDQLKVNSENSLQIASDLITGYKDIIIDNSILNFSDQFYKLDYSSRRANAKIYLISTNPKLAAEFTAYISLSLAILTAIYSKGTNDISLPALAICAVGVQKILPSMQQIYFYLSRLQSMNQYLKDLNTAIKKSYSFTQKLSFYKNKISSIKPDNFSNINMSNVTYYHQDLNKNFQNKPIIDNLSLTIDKGRKVLITGPSGSGKSTLLDLMMGFYKPKSGSITINLKDKSIDLLPDDIKFSIGNIIGHVPQNVHIYEGDIFYNIVLDKNRNSVDKELYNKILKISLLKDFISSLPNGNRTYIGPGGLQLSGGQKQRIGIARCLIKNKPILFFDECTSALDQKSTKLIMDSLFKYCFDKTIIMVSHDLSLNHYFDNNFHLNNGLLKIIE